MKKGRILSYLTGKKNIYSGYGLLPGKNDPTPFFTKEL
ncbi:Uncharacterised protein [Legionella spiritensis]|nr:Uncharacterised protein [Legionella spiritensis]